jgi:hypothetical protein
MEEALAKQVQRALASTKWHLQDLWQEFSKRRAHAFENSLLGEAVDHNSKPRIQWIERGRGAARQERGSKGSMAIQKEKEEKRGMGGSKRETNRKKEGDIVRRRDQVGDSPSIAYQRDGWVPAFQTLKSILKDLMIRLHPSLSSCFLIYIVKPIPPGIRDFHHKDITLA